MGLVYLPKFSWFLWYINVGCKDVIYPKDPWDWYIYLSLVDFYGI